MYTHIDKNIFQIGKPVLHSYILFPIMLYWKVENLPIIKAHGNTDRLKYNNQQFRILSTKYETWISYCKVSF